MIQRSSKIITHHSVITSSLCIKNCKIDKFGDFSSDIDFNNRYNYLGILSTLN